MTEKEITLLGFEKEVIEDYVGEESPDYYYYFKIADGLGFISCSEKDATYGDWYVEIFDTSPSIRFYNLNCLKFCLPLFYH